MNRAIPYIAIFLCGATAAWLLARPIEFIGTVIFGYEISSQLSFPGNHMARIYCRPGLGDQQLSLEVDGRGVWASPDLGPGDIGGRPEWSADGKRVSLVTNDGTLYTYNVSSRKGQAFIGKEAELGEH